MIVTKQEWLKDCAEAFFTYGGASPEEADKLAAVCLASIAQHEGEEAALENDPVEAAKEEMSYWG